ncbi:MAG: hypothetical protein HY961_21035 [Ignavibacteriae bacterium]|nr:hypothetical protein [Ignavibacteriota bacterium]
MQPMQPLTEIPMRFEFYRARDFGDTLSATFTFLRQEFVPFGKILVYILGPLLIVSVIVELFFQAPPEEALTGPYWAGVGLLLVVTLMQQVVLALIVNHYIRLYIANDESRFDPKAMVGYCAETFWRIVGVEILLGLMLGLAFLLLIVPGVYLSISSSLLVTAAIQEDCPFSDALARSTQLIKQYWWYTLGLIIIVSIIMYIFQLVLFAPTFVMSFVTAMHGFTESTDTVWVKAAQAVGHLATFFYVIPLVALVVHFYSQIEKKEAAGLERKVASLDGLAEG